MDINDRVRVGLMTGTIVNFTQAQGFRIYGIQIDPEFWDLLPRNPYQTDSTITLCEWNVERE